jgi:hypothetical protein
MGLSKEIFCIMREEQFNAMQQQERESLIYVEFRESNEYDNNKDDKNYLTLKKAEKKAKNELQTYLFNKRNNQ